MLKKLKNAEKVIVAKALDGQRYPLPLCEYMCQDASRAAAVQQQHGNDAAEKLWGSVEKTVGV